MSTLTTLDILKKGRELIADPARWITRTYAQSRYGADCNVLSNAATCFCSVGALCRAAGMSVSVLEGYDGIPKAPYRALQKAMGDMPAEFNDTHSHALVLAAWDRAIAAEEAKQ